MNKGIGILFIILFILALLGIGAFYLFLFNPTVEELSSIKKQYEEQLKESEALNTELTELKRQIEIFNKKIGEKEADITKLTAKIRELSDITGDLTNEKRKLEEEKSDLETQKEQLESARKKLLSSIETSEEEKLKLKEELEKKEKELQQLRNISNDLAKRFETEIQEGDINITRIGDRLILEVSNKVLFEIGSAEINSEGKQVIKKVAEVLQELDASNKFIQIGGHTDNTPMKGDTTNWELSSARAVNVLKLLQSEGVDPTSLYAASFGEYQPKADNSTEEGKALNRRIDIQILPKPISKEEAKDISGMVDSVTNE